MFFPFPPVSSFFPPPTTDSNISTFPFILGPTEARTNLGQSCYALLGAIIGTGIKPLHLLNCLFVTVGKILHFHFPLEASRISILANNVRLVLLLFGEGGLKRRSSSRERVEWTRASRADRTRPTRQGFVYQDRLKLISIDSLSIPA